MPSNYRTNDPYVNEQVDLDDVFITDAWLVDQFVGGTLFTFGFNSYGQLGNGTRTDYSSPVQVGSLTNWKQISGGYAMSAAIKTDGTLWTWGQGIFGALGNGTAVNGYSSPIQIGSLTNWKQVQAASGTTYALKTDGTLWAWGYNNVGQLGNGTTISYSSPIQIGSLNGWKNIAICSFNFYFTAAIKTDGTLWTWGYNAYGQLGNGTTSYYSSPIQIGSLTNWKQVAGGIYFTAAVKTDGTLWTWGYNSNGELGNGTRTDYSSPVQVGSLTNWKQVAGGSYNTSAIKTDGTLWAWGYNSYGTLGNGTATIPYSSPVQVGSLTNWKQVSMGQELNAAITYKDLG